jgi:hypothetical protein
MIEFSVARNAAAVAQVRAFLVATAPAAPAAATRKRSGRDGCDRSGHAESQNSAFGAHGNPKYNIGMRPFPDIPAE